MNHSRIFERVYCTPLALTPAAFRSVDQALRPRIFGTAALTEGQPAPSKAGGQQDALGRKTRAAATTDDAGTVTDPRLYGYLPSARLAVIPVKGILARNVSAFEAACFGLAGYEPIAAALRQADAADDVDQIILDVDSPGGECMGCQEVANLIAGMSKPVIGFTDGMAASAAYCLISRCTEVYCTVSSVLGSIGVICAILDDTGALAKEGYKMEHFTAGEGKSAGHSGYALSDADRAKEQEKVDYCYAMFADSVRAGRGATVVAPLEAKSAEIYIGASAVAAGLADDVVSGFDELIDLLSTVVEDPAAEDDEEDTDDTATDDTDDPTV